MCNITSNHLIERLVLNFFKGVYVNLQPEDIELMTWSTQETFLNRTIHSALFKKYPTNLNFCRVFFKKIIQAIEPKQEIHDDMYKFMCFTMNDSEDIFIYHHYVIKNNLSEVVTIKETKNMVINGTTGLKTWEAALMLSDWSLCNKHIFCNKKVLELGSGVGLTGITIAKYCLIKSMLMSDCHSEVLKTIDENIKINFPEAIEGERCNTTMYTIGKKNIGALMLDWNEINNVSSCLIPDIILGADIVYDPSILQPLLNVLNLFHTRNNNVEVFIASVIRNKDTFSTFLAALESANFKYTQLHLENNNYIDWDANIDKCLLKISK